MKNMRQYATYAKTIKPVAGTDVVAGLMEDFKKAFPGVVEWTRDVEDKLEIGK